MERGVKVKKSKISKQPNQSPSSAILEVAPAPCQDNGGTKYEPLKFKGQISYCQTVIEVERATMELLDRTKENCVGQIFLGFDVEWKPFGRGEAPNKAAVVQICGDCDYCYVMHIFYSGIPPVLKSLLEDDNYLKVGICIANDARKIADGYNVHVQPMRDLSDVAKIKLARPANNWSLSSLTQAVLQKELEKPREIRMGNWERENLSKDQLHYAATDAFASWHLYKAINDMPDLKNEK